MYYWIGKLDNGTITGLFDTEKTHTLHDADSSASAWRNGDLFTIAETDGHDRDIGHLADHGSPTAAVYEVLARKGLNPCHPPECEAETLTWLKHPGIDDPDLQNLTHLPFVTIDNEDSRDLDQALYIDSDNNGHLHIYYALADAAFYVRPGSAIFGEAIKRAVTYYVPGLAVPMLPRGLSEDLVSLNPGVDRRCLLFEIIIATNGDVLHTTITRALINSHAKLAYLKVQDFYDHIQDDKEHPYTDSPFAASLLNLREAGTRRIKHAERRDVVDYNRHEASVTLEQTQQHLDANNDHSCGFRIQIRQRCDCEKYNEQISLLCNMEGARRLESLHKAQGTLAPELQSIFRIHSPPLRQRLEKLREMLDQLVALHGLEDHWRWHRDQPLADYVQALPDKNSTDEHNRYPLRLAIERMILLTNRASFFSEEPGPHHALGVESYARFSSPMREMAGIFTHKETLEALKLQPPAESSQDQLLQDSIVAAANAAKKIQKELDQEFHLMAIDSYLHRDLSLPVSARPVRGATIMGMRSGKIYASVDGFGADLKIYLDDLGRQFNCTYKTTDVSARADTDNSDKSAPVFNIGDRINLRLEHYDSGNRRFVLSPV